jgi:hypothetical protein
VKLDTPLGKAGGVVIEITESRVTVDLPEGEPLILKSKE